MLLTVMVLRNYNPSRSQVYNKLAADALKSQICLNASPCRITPSPFVNKSQFLCIEKKGGESSTHPWSPSPQHRYHPFIHVGSRSLIPFLRFRLLINFSLNTSVPEFGVQIKTVLLLIPKG